MDALRSYVKTILMFLLFLRVVSFLFPENAYEKYVRPVCALMLVLLIVKPLTGWRDEFGEIAERFLQVAAGTSLQTEGVVFSGDEVYEEAVMEKYREELKLQLATLVAEEGYLVSEFFFVLGEKQEHYGAIERLQVILQKNENAEKNGERIKRIVISPGEWKEKQKQCVKSAEELFLQEKLSGFYRLEKAQVDVTIRED